MIASLRAALWATRASRAARRQIARGGLAEIDLPRVPPVPDEAGRGVHAVLRRLPLTCLHRAAVLQAWHLSRGDERDLVIGVTAPSRGFEAHAWLEGDRGGSSDRFQELVRVPAVVGGSAPPPASRP